MCLLIAGSKGVLVLQKAFIETSPAHFGDEQTSSERLQLTTE